MSNVERTDDADIGSATCDGLPREMPPASDSEQAKSASASDGADGSARTLLSQSRSDEPQYRRSLFRR